MTEVVIVGAVRTAIGSHGGALRNVTAQELARVVLAGSLRCAGLSPAALDEVILGCVNQQSDAPNIARVAALLAGVPHNVPAFTVQRLCASGLQAITSACQAIRAGDGHAYLVGGAESMSSAPYVVRGARWGLKLRNTAFVDTIWEGLTDPICGQLMGRTAETLAVQYGISRQDQDEFAVASQQKAATALAAGRFTAEIVPVPVSRKVPGQAMQQAEFQRDECPNPGLTPETAARYPATFMEGGTVTPANSCPLADGAAALVVLSAERAAELGVKPWAYVRSYAFAGVPPEVMGIGPALAVPAALRKAGLALSDVGLIELNEAFAAQALAVGRELEPSGWDWGRVNVNGGAIALGHPVGCTGARIVVTLLHEMARRDTQFGLATLCVGGGQGGALVLERR